MQFASNGAVSPWCIFRTCVKHAASVKHAALSQLHRSNAQCRTNLPVLGATHASQTERSLHTQLREMARTSTVESPATAGFPLSEEADSLAASKERSQTAKTGLSQGSSATVLDDSQHPVTASAVPSYAWPVLLKLKLAGHDTYIVGGTVRDLILGNTPKDVDLVTSAHLHQVKRLTRRCQIVGRRFPIALVKGAGNSTIEISSLHSSKMPPDASELDRLDSQRSLRPAHLSKSWSSVWRQNVLQRDFTVNALVYDPFSQLLFDYAGGVADCAKQRLQCCVDPTTSFTHDPIRMLRAVRVCSRTDLTVSKDVQAAIKQLAPQLSNVNGSRVALEVCNIFCYGNAVRTLHLLWRLHLLDVMMPPFALYLHKYKLKRNAVASAGIKHAMPLLSLLYQLDQQYSVVKSAPANLLHALLASSLLVDIIASHSSRLQDLLAQAQADSDNQIGAHKTAKSKRKAKQQQGKAFLTPVVDQAVEKWHERMQMPLAAQDKEARTSMLFDSLAIAALEYLQSQTLPGILTHAEKPAVKRLLAISWHSTSPHDMGHKAAEQNDPGAGKRSFNQHTRDENRSQQLKLNDMLLEAGIDWHKLLPMPDKA